MCPWYVAQSTTHTHKGQQHSLLSEQTVCFLSVFLNGGSEGTTSGLALLPTQPFLENGTFSKSRLLSQLVSTVNAIHLVDESNSGEKHSEFMVP